MVERILLEVSYDGTDFVGWQRQPRSHGLSVQQALEDCFSDLFGEHVAVAGAGRTDSGVHAFAQCCHFDCPKPVPVEKLPQIINHKLPRGICVTNAKSVAADFHARFDAKGKHYRYVIENVTKRHAFSGRYSWQMEQSLDTKKMEQAARLLLGEHDFRNFTVSGCQCTSFTRCISRLSVTPQEAATPCLPFLQLGPAVVIDAEGNGFLYKMVRIIVGRLVAVGKGQLPPEIMKDFLSGECRENIPPAPPQGLMLVQVKY